MVWVVEPEGRWRGSCLSEICTYTIRVNLEPLLFGAYRDTLCFLLGESERRDVLSWGDVGP